MSNSIRKLCLVAALIAIAFHGQAADSLPDPVDAGKSALRKTKASWYDVEADDVKIVAKRKSTLAGERQDWQKKQKRPEWSVDWDWNWDWWWDWNWNSSGGAGGGGGFFGWLSSLTFGQLMWHLFQLLLTIAAVVALAYLLRRFLPRRRKEQPLAQVVAEERTDEERIENLPIQPTKKKGDFLSMAEGCYEAGNFGEAIVYLFSHRLLQLDRAGQIRLTRGKTNRQYLYEIQDSSKLQSILGQTIVNFEEVFFGKHELTRDRFEKTWQANSEFDSIVQKAMG